MRIVFISDTHLKSMLHPVPEGDILVHSGDATMGGTPGEIYEFYKWFKALPHETKIFVPGNHDLGFEDIVWDFTDPSNDRGKVQRANEQAKRMMPGIHVLINDELVVDGVKFYGCSWQPEFCDWGFNLPRRGARLKEEWAKIPKDTTVLITHSPPHGILDVTRYGNENVGCELLAERLQELDVKIHSFGHIHECYGTKEKNGTLFVNASTCTLRYEATNAPILAELQKEDDSFKVTNVGYGVWTEEELKRAEEIADELDVLLKESE